MPILRLSATAVAVLASLPLVAQATTYYVSSSFTGPSTGTDQAPLKHIEDVNALTLQPGDRVLFKCGDAWPAGHRRPVTLQVRAGVTYGAYAGSTEGACDYSSPPARPILRGAQRIGGTASGISWSIYKGNIYVANMSALWPGDVKVAQLADYSVVSDKKRMQRARHPNLSSGTFLSSGGSRYFRVGSATPIAPDSQSHKILALDPQMPTDATETSLVGASAYVRQVDWHLSRYNVTAHSSGQVTLSLDDKYHQWDFSFKADANHPPGGYWLENQRWMLDEPGEWYYDQAQKLLYVWKTDNSSPASDSDLYAAITESTGAPDSGTSDFGIKARDVNGFKIRNLDVRETVLDGISIWGNTDNPSAIKTFEIDSTTVSQAGRHGILVHGVNGTGQSSKPTISNSIIKYSMNDGINLRTSQEDVSPTRMGWWMGEAVGVQVLNNRVTYAGDDMFALAAINVGRGNPAGGDAPSLVQANYIAYASGRGIDFGAGATINRNSLIYVCWRFDDCGGIYTNGLYSGPTYNMQSTVSNNHVTFAFGSADGRPSAASSAYGIYLDDFANGVSVTGNYVNVSDSGLYLHAARNTTVSNNVIASSRVSGILIGPAGGTSDPYHLPASNTISDNVVAGIRDAANPSGAAAVIHISDTTSSTANFAAYSNNRYATLVPQPFVQIALDPALAPPSDPNADFTYRRRLTFAEWQGVLQEDTNASLPYANLPAYTLVSGASANLVVNGSFSSATNNWLTVTGTQATYLSTAAQGCYNGPCVKLTGDGSAPVSQGRKQLLFYTFTPTFTITAGQTYLAVFDAKADTAGDVAEPHLQRYGSAGDLSSWGNEVSLSTSWKRYMVPLKAKASSVGGDGRLDLVLKTNSAIYLDNVRLFQVNKVEDAELKAIHTFRNPPNALGDLTQSCPATQTANCSGYRDLKTGLAVSFPLTLTPGEAKVIVWTGSNWQDNDRDGVPNAKDTTCTTATPASAGANEVGCGIGQQ